MLKALIIDDEERARHSLVTLIKNYCEGITVIAEATNVPDGVLQINKHKPDIVFLDVEMPEYNGFELFDFIRDIDFEVVFVTAYSEYAIKAFEVSAIDYILKPVDIEALQKTAEKIKNKHQQLAFTNRMQLLRENFANEEISRIALPMSDGLLFIDVKDIVMLEADGAYTQVFLNKGNKVLVSKKLKFFEDILEGRPQFYRPHRSYLINLNYIKKYLKGENEILMENNLEVAISRDLKQDFENHLKEQKLL